MSRTNIKSLLALCWLLAALPAHAELNLPDRTGLQQVGAGTLRWLGFRVYDASTWATTAPLPSDGTVPTPFALQIIYAHDIDAADLVDATATAWQKLGLLDERAKNWLPGLRTLWPNVKAGDCLVLYVDANGNAGFYYNNQLLGRIDDPQFASRFAAIWLHPDSSEPTLRNQLLGKAP
ncbi:hypothetical protein HPT27_07460 [Permianibacter sp. IMCC34836]|uniref:chalcone isomerase family protein n=1 Tax=Permianibacter fluminis TaxID=2738515 RepID=UPI0015534E7B|nr:chalcone isomerase family protein [Permianibacter fluminis]NQD36860.1 hypothetical protein [Permianibacter fluminis]